MTRSSVSFALFAAAALASLDATAARADPPASDAAGAAAAQTTSRSVGTPPPASTAAPNASTPSAAAPNASAPAGAPTGTAPANAAPTNAAAPPPAPAPAVNAPGGNAPAAATSKPVPLAADAFAVRAGRYRLDPDHGKITWSVNHLGFSTYTGQFPGVTADLVLDPKDLAKTTLTATIVLESVDSANSKLDAHLKEEGFFNTAKFPEATFRSTAVTATGPRTARIDGQLTLRGKTAPIVISATFNNAGVDPVDKQYTVGFDGAAIIRRSIFGVSQYVPLVGDDVLVRLEGEFKPAS